MTNTMARNVRIVGLLLFVAVSVQGLRVIEPEQFAGFYNSPWIDRYGKNMLVLRSYYSTIYLFTRI